MRFDELPETPAESRGNGNCSTRMDTDGGPVRLRVCVTGCTQGPCTYILTRHTGGEFVVHSQNVQCGYGGVTCTKAVSVFVNGTRIELVMGRPPTVDGRQLATHQLVDFRFNGGRLVHNGLNIVVFFDGGLNVVWDGGSLLPLLPSTQHETKQLCPSW